MCPFRGSLPFAGMREQGPLALAPSIPFPPVSSSLVIILPFFSVYGPSLPLLPASKIASPAPAPITSFFVFHGSSLLSPGAFFFAGGKSIHCSFRVPPFVPPCCFLEISLAPIDCTFFSRGTMLFPFFSFAGHRFRLFKEAFQSIDDLLRVCARRRQHVVFFFLLPPIVKGVSQTLLQFLCCAR